MRIDGSGQGCAYSPMQFPLLTPPRDLQFGYPKSQEIDFGYPADAAARTPGPARRLILYLLFSIFRVAYVAMQHSSFFFL